MWNTLSRPVILKTLRMRSWAADDAQGAVLATDQLEAADEHAETGGVHEGDVLEVDDEVGAAGCDLLVEHLAQQRRRVDVDLAADVDDRHGALLAGGDRKVHGHPFTCSFSASGRLQRRLSLGITVAAMSTTGPTAPVRRAARSTPRRRCRARLRAASRAAAARPRGARPGRLARRVARPGSTPACMPRAPGPGSPPSGRTSGEAADLAHAGQHVVMATGHRLGQEPRLPPAGAHALVEGAAAPTGRGATALYLSPTKALAADQLARVQAMAIPGRARRDL